MSRQRIIPRRLNNQVEETFETAERAWLWYAQCQVARASGARQVADAALTARPCDPDDIYRVVKRLFAARLLTGSHLRVMFAYGLALLCPDERLEDERGDARDWNEAMKRLRPYLVEKGIVA